MTEPTWCPEFDDLLAEVATGAASGADRARALAHLAGCDGCRRRLEELTRVADEVLLAAPEREPPAGFESAVLGRIAELDRPSRSRRPLRRHRVFRAAVSAAAAVLIAAASAGAVWSATSDERERAAQYDDILATAHGEYFNAAPVNDENGTQVGHVFVYQGDPSWVFVVLGDAPERGTYEVAVTAWGETETVAICEVADDECGTGATVDTDIKQISTVRMTGPDGITLTADLW